MTKTVVWVLAFLIVAIAPSKGFSIASSTRSSSQSKGFPRQPSPSLSTTTSLNLAFDVDASFVAGSVLWGLNFYYGFDWILAPLGTGLDSDFNPATQATTFIGKLLAGKSFSEATIVDNEGERPEMGSRIGSGANIAYAVAVESNETQGDWLSDREAGLSSNAPFPLRIVVAILFGIVGVVTQFITQSYLTAAVLVIPALVYEIGRPSLPTRAEAIFDAKLDAAVTKFAEERMVLYGQDSLPEGVPPVRRDEATNERELVNAFRGQLEESSKSGLQNQEVSDFQIEMRMRAYGEGRSVGGFIKGIRLLEGIP